MKKAIYLIITIIVVGGAILIMTKGNGNNDPDANRYDQGVQGAVDDTDTDTKATDYNSSRSNRTTDNGVIDNVDQDCGESTTLEDEDCVPESVDDDCNSETGECTVSEAVDVDSDDDSLPIEDDSSAQAGAYIKIDDVKGDATDD